MVGLLVVITGAISASAGDAHGSSSVEKLNNCSADALDWRMKQEAFYSDNQGYPGSARDLPATLRLIAYKITQNGGDYSATVSCKAVSDSKKATISPYSETPDFR